MSAPVTLTIVVPPVAGGVWDFSHAISQELSGSVVREITRSDTRALDVGTVLLHYSGYGYAKRGAPLWILDEIRARRRRFRRLGVFFHELYATGPPWSSAFWLSPVQRHVARQLAELSDFWLASCESYGKWLRRFAGNRPHHVLPVMSNVGEPVDCPTQRRPTVVLFGGAPLRESTYKTGGADLLAWVRAQQLELHDIGPPLQDRALEQHIRAAGAVVHGRLHTEQVSSLLADARYGVVAYRGDALGKSGVLAAYSSHAVCPIVLADHVTTPDGLRAGRNFHAGIPPRDFPAASAMAVGKGAWCWYQNHRLERHVAATRDLLQADPVRATTMAI